jgi:hypothetical protein
LATGRERMSEGTKSWSRWNGNQRAPQTRCAPSPLWGRAGEGGSCGDARALLHRATPTPNPSPQGGGERTERAATFCNPPPQVNEQ